MRRIYRMYLLCKRFLLHYTSKSILLVCSAAANAVKIAGGLRRTARRASSIEPMQQTLTRVIAEVGSISV